MTSAAQQLLSACPPCCWLHPWALGHATYVLGDLFLLHPSRTDALEPLFAFFPLWQKTIVLLPLLENWPLMSHQAHALLTTVCSFGPFLSSLLLPSSSGKSSNSTTHSHRQNFFSPRERKMYLFQFLGPVVGTTHVQLRVTTWMEDFLKQILSEIVTVCLKHLGKILYAKWETLQAALKTDGEWMSYLLRAGRTDLHHKATTASWHLEGIVRQKAKDWTGRDADDHLLLGFSCRGSSSYCSLPLSYAVTCPSAGSLCEHTHSEKGTSRVLFPKHCWSLPLGWDPGVLQLKSQTMMNRDQELLEHRYAMSTHHGFHPHNFTLA